MYMLVASEENTLFLWGFFATHFLDMIVWMFEFNKTGQVKCCKLWTQLKSQYNILCAKPFYLGTYLNIDT